MATEEGIAKNRFLDAWEEWGDSIDQDLEIVKAMRAKRANASNKT